MKRTICLVIAATACVAITYATGPSDTLSVKVKPAPDSTTQYPLLTVNLSGTVSHAKLERRRTLLGMGNFPLDDSYSFAPGADMVLPTVTLPAGEQIYIKINRVTGTSTYINAMQGTSTLKVDQSDGTTAILVPATKATTVDVYETASSSSTDKLSEFQISVGPATVADFSSQISALMVFEHGSAPQFGIRAPTYAISSKITVDAVSIFAGGSTASLGGGLSYSTLLGTSTESNAKGWFGFPAKISFTIGVSGVTFGNNVNGSGSHPLFFAIGIAIPTGKITN